MARPGLRNNLKFRRLCALLPSECEPHVVGHLETLWEVAYETGNDCIGTQEDVELAAMWDGTPGEFFSALLNAGSKGEAGFIEEAGDGKFRIHDLLENAPAYVVNRIRQRNYRNRQRKQRVSKRSARVTDSSATSDGQCKRVTHIPALHSSKEECSLFPAETNAQPTGVCFSRRGGSQWEMPQNVLSKYLATYAERVDVKFELKKASQWLLDNSNRRPSSVQGMKKFLTGWLNRASDSNRRTVPGSRVAAVPENGVFNAETGEIVTPLE
jgi:hypothetical protein